MEGERDTQSRVVYVVRDPWYGRDGQVGQSRRAETGRPRASTTQLPVPPHTCATTTNHKWGTRGKIADDDNDYYNGAATSQLRELRNFEREKVPSTLRGLATRRPHHHHHLHHHQQHLGDLRHHSDASLSSLHLYIHVSVGCTEGVYVVSFPSTYSPIMTADSFSFRSLSFPSSIQCSVCLQTNLPPCASFDLSSHQRERERERERRRREGRVGTVWRGGRGKKEEYEDGSPSPRRGTRLHCAKLQGNRAIEQRKRSTVLYASWWNSLLPSHSPLFLYIYIYIFLNR